MKLLLLVPSLLLLTNPFRAYAACSTVPGAVQLWSRSDIHWVWIGEVHGTSETPAVFGDMVCDALAHGRHVTVALERPLTEQAAIDSIIGSDDAASAEQKLLNQPDWKTAFDGRTSQAMLRLLLQLRDLKSQYPILKVSAVVDPNAFAVSQKADDEAIGHAVLGLYGGKSEDLVLVLTGNVHGLKSPFRGFDTAATYLPSKQVVSLQVTDAGGQAWIWNEKGCGVASGRGMPDKDKSRPFGIYLDPSLARVGSVDGILALGRPTTASTPANATALASAACRETLLSQ